MVTVCPSQFATRRTLFHVLVGCGLLMLKVSRLKLPVIWLLVSMWLNTLTKSQIWTFNSRERSGINTILHELNPLFTINVTMRDIKSKNVYSRVNSKATTQWRKTESANGVHLEGVASDNRSS